MIEDLFKDAQKVLKDKSQLKSYELQEKILQHLVTEYPDHTVPEAVDLKAKLLNLFYSTGIQAMNVMVNKILGVANIDSRLENGDLNLVADIAEIQLSDGKKRYNYSFATKYCALHQPDKYPIYDSIVANVLLYLLKNNKIPPYTLRGKKQAENDTCKNVGEYEKALHDYPYYVNVYDSFCKAYNLSSLSYRDVDFYIWGAFKSGGKKYLIEKKAPINPRLYRAYRQL